jgi:protein phosphatase
MDLRVWGQTDVGLKRKENQDSILVDTDIQLFIVADGMGGHRGGEVASAMAVEMLQKHLSENIVEGLSSREVRQVFSDGYNLANRKIYHRSSIEQPELKGMGTTMVAILIYEDKIFIANVGDSRAYLIKEPYMWQVTEDHSYVNEQIRAGMVENESELFMARNVITRSVGYEADINIDILERDLQVGEVYLLCSDGLSGLVNDKEILKIIQQNKIESVVSQCIEAAKMAGGDDNVSVLLIEIG